MKVLNGRIIVRYSSAALAANPEKSMYYPAMNPGTTESLLFSPASLARGEYLRTHFKNMREVAAAISGTKSGWNK
jgi:hypothetical protein